MTKNTTTARRTSDYDREDQVERFRIYDRTIPGGQQELATIAGTNTRQWRRWATGVSEAPIDVMYRLELASWMETFDDEDAELARTIARAKIVERINKRLDRVEGSVVQIRRVHTTGDVRHG